MNPAIVDLLNYYWADIVTVFNSVGLLVLSILRGKKGA